MVCADSLRRHARCVEKPASVADFLDDYDTGRRSRSENSEGALTMVSVPYPGVAFPPSAQCGVLVRVSSASLVRGGGDKKFSAA